MGGVASVVSQGLWGIQVTGGPLNVAARDVHHTVHYHRVESTDSSLPSILEDVPNFRAIQIATLGRATPGTGLWIVDCETFRIWLDPDGWLRIMWGTGMPGAGKTIAASTVINALEAHAQHSNIPVCVCYIYFRYSDHTKATVRSFLEVLVKQTLERHPDCLPLFNEAYAKHVREKTQPTEEELLALLRRFAGLMITFYVLDALDEAPTEVQLPILESLASLRVKLFITSRPLKAVEAHFRDVDVIHHFIISAHDDDLDLHITKEISSCRSPELCALLKQEVSLRDKIFVSIKRHCGGMFLFASLQLAALRDCTSVHDVEETLANAPTSIEDLYVQTWSRILSQTPTKVFLVKKMLVWILNATRSLTLEELQYAVATDPDTCLFDKTRLVSEHALIGMCRGLVIVEDKTNLVRLVHYTAKDVLMRLIADSFPSPHTPLAAICMARLTECGIHRSTINSEDELDETLRSTPFLQYAYDSWSIHARESLSDGPAALRCAEFVQTCHSFPIKEDSLLFLGPFDCLGPLHVVAFFDLPMELAGPTCLQSPNSTTASEGRTALHFACLRRSVTAAKELLRLPGLLVNATDKQGVTPLAWSIYGRQESQVSLLLDHQEIDVNAQGLWDYVPLHWAIDFPNEVAMKALLSHPRIDVNAVGMYGTPLSMASERGREGMVQLLLAHPAIRVTGGEIQVARNSIVNGGVRERMTAPLQEFMDQRAADLGEQ